MFAVIRSGNQQFRVHPGDSVKAPLLRGKSPQDRIQVEVLAMEGEDGFFAGTQELKGAVVTAQVLRHGLQKKVIVFKKKRRKGYRRTKGWRQPFTELQIIDFTFPSGTVVSKPSTPVRKAVERAEKQGKSSQESSPKAASGKTGIGKSVEKPKKPASETSMTESKPESEKKTKGTASKASVAGSKSEKSAKKLSSPAEKKEKSAKKPSLETVEKEKSGQRSQSVKGASKGKGSLETGGTSVSTGKSKGRTDARPTVAKKGSAVTAAAKKATSDKGVKPDKKAKSDKNLKEQSQKKGRGKPPGE